MSKERLTNNILNALSKHPYLCLFGICLLIDPFFFGSIENIPNNALWLESIIITAMIALFGVHRYNSGKLTKTRLVIFLIFSLTAVLSSVQLYAYSQNKALWHFIGGCVIVFILYHLVDLKKYHTQIKSFLIIGIGMMLKLYYVLVTSVYDRQHDVNSFGGDSGHAGYIEYLLYNHKLADFDVRERWQFCHPPLHHAISALWIFLNENVMQTGYDQARESIQMLTLFYSGCIIISAYKIFRHFGFEGNALYIPLTIVSFHPAYILFSGSINNDPLSTALVTGAVLCTLKWYRSPTMKNILKIALCVGFAMMSKVTAATISPAIALVFLIVFIRKFKKDWKNLLKQYICFGIVCVPLGLWYGIRNYIKWKIPLTYVSELSEYEPQYIKNLTFFQRVTNFSFSQLKSPYIQWEYTDENGVISGYNEYNPLIALMKNSVFGESINQYAFEGTEYINVVSTIFFWLNVAVAGFAFYAMIKMCFVKCSAEAAEKVLFVGFYVVMMAVFYKNAASYPFVCTMNFRYITPTIIVGTVFIGLIMKEKSESKAINYCMSAATVSFSATSTMVYLAIN